MQALLVSVLTWFINVFLGRFLIGGIFAGIIKIGVGLSLAKVLSVLTIGTISFAGAIYSVDWLEAQITRVLLMLKPEHYQMASMVASKLQLDAALTMVFTAFYGVISLWTFKGVWRVFGFGNSATS